jgi:GNAT superfamily N-acetyltransferase
LIHERAWHVAYRHVFPPERLSGFRSDRSRWRTRLTAPPRRSAVIVAVDGDVIVGFASVGESREEPGGGELYAIYVDPGRWRTGAGRTLLRRAEEELRHLGFAAATLWVLEDNPRARGFYEAEGWKADGERKLDTFLGLEVAEVRYGRMLA